MECKELRGKVDPSLFLQFLNCGFFAHTQCLYFVVFHQLTDRGIQKHQFSHDICHIDLHCQFLAAFDVGLSFFPVWVAAHHRQPFLDNHHKVGEKVEVFRRYLLLVVVLHHLFCQTHFVALFSVGTHDEDNTY